MDITAHRYPVGTVVYACIDENRVIFSCNYVQMNKEYVYIAVYTGNVKKQFSLVDLIWEQSILDLNFF